jgi:hypothetical protein
MQMAKIYSYFILIFFILLLVYLNRAGVYLPQATIDGIEKRSFIKDINNQISFNCTTIGNLGGRIALGDIDGDGNRDIVLHVWASNRGQDNDGLLLWYRYPDWIEFTIENSAHFFGDAVGISDLDMDGDNDVITCQGNDTTAVVCWYENQLTDPEVPWFEHIVDTLQIGSEVKDIKVDDIDDDGRPDIVVRTRQCVGIYFQEDSGTSVSREIVIREREGMVLGDLDGDGDKDIILNGFFLENPTDARVDDWLEYTIDEQWYTDDDGDWQDHSVMVDVGDINGDGVLDIVFSHSEKPAFNISWYESDNPKGGQTFWRRHDVAIFNYCHTLKVADMDRDGDVDIVAGNSIWENLARLVIYLNDGTGLNWTEFEVDEKGVYKAEIGDIDEDGDGDIVSARSWGDPPVQIWRNSMDIATLPLDLWQRHLIDDALPEKAVFIRAGDLDGDGNLDIAAGAWWWKNPGTIEENWNRLDIGAPLNNVAVLNDFDNDGKLDILGTEGVGANIDYNFTWARNIGKANFEILSNINPLGSGDFLQGCVIGDFGNGEQIILSWHNGGGGIQTIAVPSNPVESEWESNMLTTITQMEDLSIGDIDCDGDMDLLLGTKWLRNDGGSWSEFMIGGIEDLDPDAEPDRNNLVDVNNDKHLDAVVSFENGEYVVWFEAPANPEFSWRRHIISTVKGEGFSLDTGDIDADGDIDVVIGEHRGSLNNRVIIFENRDWGSIWIEHIIDSGMTDEIDHHDGTQLVDLDKDGDLDIMSLGWNNLKVWIYENKAIHGLSDLRLDVKIYLEGPYDVYGDTMTTYLGNNGFLPLSQPYCGVPWHYPGNEQVVSIPANTVDWVLVQLRSGIDSATTVASRAAFLRSDGRIVDLDGKSQVNFSGVSEGDYYLVVRHRNHLSIMSATAQALSFGSASLYDFTDDMSKTYTLGPDPMRDFANGKYGIFGGDSNGDGFINSNDLNLMWRPENRTSGYKLSDFTCDGFINSDDINLVWRINNGLGTQVP